MRFNIKKIEKFKSIYIYISFLRERSNTIDYETEAACALILPGLLSNRTANYPSKKLIQIACNNLYSASIKVTRESYYSNLSLDFMMSIVNPRFVSDKKYLNKCFEMLNEVINNPLLNEDKTGFDEKLFNERQKIAFQLSKQMYDNKQIYAYYQLFNIMKREEIPLLYMVSKSDLEKVDNIKLYNYYQHILQNSEIIVNVVGDVKENDIKEMLESFMPLQDKKIPYNFYQKEEVLPRKVIEKVEYQKVNQTILELGYRFKEYAPEKDPVIHLFNSMLSGMFSSTLNSVVREKNSLAYSIMSDFNEERHAMCIIAGIDKKNIDKVKEVIQEEIAKYKTGKIENGAELLRQAKEDYYRDYDAIDDDPISKIVTEYDDMISAPYDSNWYHNAVEQVKIEDIFNFCKELYLDTTYILTSGEEHE